jgi:hypothetical protein
MGARAGHLQPNTLKYLATCQISEKKKQDQPVSPTVIHGSSRQKYETLHRRNNIDNSFEKNSSHIIFCANILQHDEKKPHFKIMSNFRIKGREKYFYLLRHNVVKRAENLPTFQKNMWLPSSE